MYTYVVVAKRFKTTVVAHSRFKAVIVNMCSIPANMHTYPHAIIVCAHAAACPAHTQICPCNSTACQRCPPQKLHHHADNAFKHFFISGFAFLNSLVSIISSCKCICVQVVLFTHTCCTNHNYNVHNSCGRISKIGEQLTFIRIYT